MTKTALLFLGLGRTTVRQRLERLPAPHAAHYGVVRLPPPEDGTALAADIAAPYVVSRLLTWHEAVSSFAIKGTDRTFDHLLSLEEEASAEQRDAVRSWAGAGEYDIAYLRCQGMQVMVQSIVERLAAGLQESAHSAYGEIDQLAEAGILTERTGKTHNRIISSTKVLALLNRRFGVEAAAYV